ncbi:MAG: hypothetical protein NTW52_07845 [Planctomycetota bacterium]|jgi:hypothetical protein|nr:hypothetical protein [Planctomycetota bacterium]
MHEFVRAWKVAGDEMERLRHERLQSMAASAGASLMGAVDSSSQEDMYGNGLARWQAWMIRWRLQTLMEKNTPSASRVKKSSEDA